MPVKLGQLQYISNVFGHVYNFFSFFFSFAHLFHAIGVTPIDTYVV